MDLARTVAAFGAIAAGSAICPEYADAAVRRAEFSVASEPGVEVAVREVVDGDARPAEAPPLILVHGARVPGLASFDLPVPGGSLAEDLARKGHRVYVMDVRGYGRSTRPAAMTAPPAGERPLVNSHEAVRDIDAVVRSIAARTGSQQVALLGWATGGQWAGMYASLHPERISHLVLLNALYGGIDGHAMLGRGTDMEDPRRPGQFNANVVGAYRLNPAASLLPVWDRTIPVENKATWRDPLVAEAYVREALASDPSSSTRSPPTFRSPSGALEDSFYMATGRQLWDAGSITARVLIVRGERDFWSRAEDVVRLESHLAQAASVAVVSMAEATHFVHLDRAEHGRDQLLAEVDALLRSGP